MEKVVFDYSKLRGRIKEKYDNESNFAKIANTSQSGLSAKLNNKTYFKPNDILLFLKLLEIPDEELKVYFFNPKVRKTEK